MAKDLIPGVVKNIPVWALPMIEGTNDEALTQDQLDILENWSMDNNIDDIWPFWHFVDCEKSTYLSNNPQFGEGPTECCTCFVLCLDR